MSALNVRARLGAFFVCSFALLMAYLNLRDLYLVRYQSQAAQGRVVSLATSQNTKGNVHRLVEFSYRFQGVEAQDSSYASETQMARLHKDGPLDIVVIPAAEQCFFYCPKAVLAPEPDTLASRAVVAGWLALAVAGVGGFLFCTFGWGRISARGQAAAGN
jgi:hypothetical protein